MGNFWRKKLGYSFQYLVTLTTTTTESTKSDFSFFNFSFLFLSLYSIFFHLTSFIRFYLAKSSYTSVHLFLFLSYFYFCSSNWFLLLVCLTIPNLVFSVLLFTTTRVSLSVYIFFCLLLVLGYSLSKSFYINSFVMVSILYTLVGITPKVYCICNWTVHR